MAVKPTVRIELEYIELVDVIVALRTRQEFLSIRSPELAAPYAALADKFLAVGRDMLGEYAYE